MKRATLITGAGGYLGQRIADKLLAETDQSLVLWARAGAVAGVAERFRRHGERVVVRGGDLGDAAPFATVDAQGIATILHAAAVTRFDVTADIAAAVNVAGTQKLLAFAERCPALETFAYVSSLYSAGLASGDVLEEARPEPPAFANEYERSKWQAEALVLAGARPFRRQILRVATVLCDDTSGAVTQHNVVHRLLKLLYSGLLPIVPGNPGTPVYLVTGELVAAATLALLGRGADGAIFHLAPAAASACTLQELLDWSHAAFCRTDSFLRRRVLKPLFADAPTFDYLAATASMFSADIGPVISVVRPFAKQLFVKKQVHNDRLVAAWPAYRAAATRELPELLDLINKTCDWLVSSAWATRER
jgi:thioester reductase-like protein